MKLHKELKQVKRNLKRATSQVENYMLLFKQLELERILACRKWFEQHVMKELLKARLITQEQLKEITFKWDNQDEEKEEK